MTILKVGIVAGEKSGDYLGAELIRALKGYYPDAEFVGLCGPLMQAEGAKTLADMDKISIFGLEGLLGSVREILAIRKKIFKELVAWQADVFIGVDVPDFNLGLEKRLREKGIPTVHYVSPTVWAWRTGRIKKIRRAVDHMLTLFPFERDFYQRHAVPVTFVGHPLAARVLQWPDQRELRNRLTGTEGKRLIAVLPGSRMSEVSRLAPEMLEAILQLHALHDDLTFAIPAANGRIHAWLQQEIQELGCAKAVTLLNGQSRELLSISDLAILASGTAALEAGMFAVPMVVMYKVAWISAAVFGHTIRVEHFSMPNHLTTTPVVPELIQQRATAGNLVVEVERLLTDPNHYQSMKAELESIAPSLTENSGQVAAQAILSMLNRLPSQ